MDNSSTIVKDTKQNYIGIDDLKSNTNYTAKIFIHNNVGYNSERFLCVDFRTKYACLLII